MPYSYEKPRQDRDALGEWSATDPELAAEVVAEQERYDQDSAAVMPELQERIASYSAEYRSAHEAQGQTVDEAHIILQGDANQLDAVPISAMSRGPETAAEVAIAEALAAEGIHFDDDQAAAQAYWLARNDAAGR